MQIQRAQRDFGQHGLGLLLLCMLPLCVAPLKVWSQTQAVVETPSRSASALTKESLQKQIAELIEQLGDENFQTRRAAELGLVRIGLPAFEQLRQAMNHPNVQVEVAARYLVRSQSVTWWLDTDPLSVRQVLQDYNDLKNEERETRMQKLASEKNNDALLALCRIARYESSEKLSKSAALFLMETFVDRLKPTEAKKLTLHVREAMGDSQRPAAEWIESMVDAIDEGAPNADRWRMVARLEYLLLEKNPRETSKFLVMRLHRVIAAHFIAHSERQEALEIVRPCLDLVENKSMQVRGTSIWAIDAGLPELVNDLSVRHSELFSHEPQLGFLLAESFLAAGDQDRARVSAEVASESIVRPKRENDDKFVEEIVAAQRLQLADVLLQRGMFDWARIEYEKTLKLELQPMTEQKARNDYAFFLSEGEEYEAAARILGDFIAKIQDNPLEKERLQKKNSFNHDAENDYAFLLGNFNFYSGKAAFHNRELAAANAFFLEALKNYPENPDILIALKATYQTGVNDQSFKKILEERITAFHENIAICEREVMNADRMLRQTKEYELAGQCNQLAWLLSNTNERPAEAVYLSLRSLELIPDYGIYQDTLARCYFAAGDIDKAISMQELAIKSEPFQRSMKRQLEEFKAAKR
jgi:tetratricopeptide (TPR) repeat protein